MYSKYIYINVNIVAVELNVSEKYLKSDIKFFLYCFYNMIYVWLHVTDIYIFTYVYIYIL